MAEETLAPVPGGNRRILYIAVGVVVVLAILFLFFIRSCGGGGGPANDYTVIYSHLALKDAADVIARLKELKIPYEMREKGTSIAVPKDKADDARLGLAEKSLPTGGAVGWEIFDEARLGATDFDRRIQLVRAISGELARTIRRITAIEDCRVQIVLPETRLFEIEKAPVTASVLLTLLPGEKLSPAQVNGIIHLVASSVENLKPQRVTIVDDHGNILSAKPEPKPLISPIYQEEAKQELLEEAKAVEGKVEELKKKEAELNKKEAELVKMAEEATAEAAPRVLSEEERTLLRIQAKQEYEEQLTKKAQSILNQFYPPNSVIVKVSLELLPPKPAKDEKIKVRSQLKEGIQIKRIHTVILVDNRLDLTASLKKTTYATIAAAIGYDRKRGDRIAIKKVPFQYALQQENGTTPVKETEPKRASWMTYVLVMYEFVVAKLGFKNFIIGIGIIFILLIIILVFRAIFGGKREREFEFGPPEFLEEEEEVPTGASAKSAMDTIEGIKGMANENPERLAALLKNWLSEEGKSK
ncbi:MAG: flagellar M-ring protein FliF [Candidatus Margulisbacteria bacterium]|nr:flagellar M-ring protein FliF [Candidatus Margulisiibacteriota bacterium]MBU1021491.1 flagellar M-ring protein FliF [Candidatus Margulisiibacteriota bacterium]MBU1728576.1 flagellar M-ring protein FliF [Candidatus Margulisiibacteriota bacterium]MBU1955845.1 flagellar M-ring protein FliF [Candidatus Margulisiibacteriota bacterium]